LFRIVHFQIRLNWLFNLDWFTRYWNCVSPKMRKCNAWWCCCWWMSSQREVECLIFDSLFLFIYDEISLFCLFMFTYLESVQCHRIFSPFLTYRHFRVYERTWHIRGSVGLRWEWDRKDRQFGTGIVRDCHFYLRYVDSGIGFGFGFSLVFYFSFHFVFPPVLK
jgi:hypothetical protein